MRQMTDFLSILESSFKIPISGAVLVNPSSPIDGMEHRINCSPVVETKRSLVPEPFSGSS